MVGIKIYFFPYEQVVWFLYKYYFLRKLAKISSIFQVKNGHEKKGIYCWMSKWKVHFHRVKTTQLLRLPCTHLPEPLGHAEKGKPQQADRGRTEQEKRERKEGNPWVRRSFGWVCGSIFGWEDTVYVMRIQVCWWVCLCVEDFGHVSLLDGVFHGFGRETKKEVISQSICLK